MKVALNENDVDNIVWMNQCDWCKFLNDKHSVFVNIKNGFDSVVYRSIYKSSITRNHVQLNHHMIARANWNPKKGITIVPMVRIPRDAHTVSIVIHGCFSNGSRYMENTIIFMVNIFRAIKIRLLNTVINRDHQYSADMHINGICMNVTYEISNISLSNKRMTEYAIFTENTLYSKIESADISIKLFHGQNPY
jgi:hypothetical protein